jgi:hypothetical protein
VAVAVVVTVVINHWRIIHPTELTG